MSLSRDKRPRLVVITRKTPLQLLLERFSTLGQAEFYLRSRAESILPLIEQDERAQAGLRRVEQAMPSDWQKVRLDRAELSRFLFAPDDVAVIVGQDGLVPNVAKYLSGQLAIGINPDPGENEGVLCPHSPAAAPAIIQWLTQRSSQFRIEPRTMVRAEREDGQVLCALNEVFIGHRSHQSARYQLRLADQVERQSSSGVIVASGTGASGWMRSIVRQRQLEIPPLTATDARLAWFVREPWPSKVTFDELNFGLLEANQNIVLRSEMGEGGQVFADGIEADALEFLNGQTLSVRRADNAFNLVMPH